MTETLPPPTDEVARLAAIVGAEAALALIEAHSGTRLYVPRTPTEALVRLVGETAAARLVSAHAGEQLKIPVARRWRIQVYRQRGISYSEIARRLGCSEDTVWRVLAAADLTRAQLTLPL